MISDGQVGCFLMVCFRSLLEVALFTTTFHDILNLQP